MSFLKLISLAIYALTHKWGSSEEEVDILEKKCVNIMVKMSRLIKILLLAGSNGLLSKWFVLNGKYIKCEYL